MYRIKVDNRIWIEKDGKTFIGNGRISLMEAIDQHGSISQAAKSIGMSYKKAWDLIDSVNNLSDETLVVKTTGGSGGGGAYLTNEGKKIVKDFRNLQDKSRRFLEEEIKKCCFK